MKSGNLNFLEPFGPLQACNRTALRFNISSSFGSSSSSIGTTTLSWVSACSTVVEHSQQEGFTELPAAGQTPNLKENQGFRAFQLSP
jgi:hypothetical protein